MNNTLLLFNNLNIFIKKEKNITNAKYTSQDIVAAINILAYIRTISIFIMIMMMIIIINE